MSSAPDAKAVKSLLDTAYGWHGGQWSPLYSFASTGGTVHSEEHRAALLSEINLCRRECGANFLEPEKEAEALERLAKYIEAAVTGAPLERRSG